MNPFQSRQPAPVRMQRLQLPPGMGRQISVRGFTFTADDEGFVTLPKDVAAEFTGHLPAPGTASTGGEIFTVEVGKITEIDAQLQSVRAEQATIKAAIARAEALLTATDGGAATEVEQLQSKRRQTVADFFRGLAKRSDVDEIDTESLKAQTRVAEDSRTRELARLGVSELQDRHLWPLQHQEAELLERRKGLALRAIAALADGAARDYRKAACEMARTLAVLRAHVLELGVDVRGDVIRDLPAFNRLDTFKDCPHAELVIALTPRARQEGAHEYIDAAAIRAEVREGFAKAGLL